MSRTLGSAYRALRDVFRAAGIASPETDARLLVADVTGVSPQRLVIEENRPLTEAEWALLEAHREARLRHVPVGRIVGHRAFWGLSFDLAPETLEPRPDTEILIEAALDWADRTGGRAQGLSIADLGTGTGAILVSLLSELPQARGLATDIQPRALAVARRNAAVHDVAERAAFVCGSWMDAIAGEWDLIVSNPPYIRSGVIPGLDREVTNHDPMVALDGGQDGLAAYRVIAAQAARLLRRPAGALIAEIGYDQGEDVARIFREAGFHVIDIRRDLGDHDRVVVAQR